jgi:hypothetical protein
LVATRGGDDRPGGDGGSQRGEGVDLAARWLDRERGVRNGG